MNNHAENGLAEQVSLSAGKKGADAENESGPSLGVLFVHGIGEQKRGDTLPWAGDALYNWLSRWVCQKSDPGDADCRPRLSDTRLTRPVPSEEDAPPYTCLYFPNTSPGPATAGQSWVLAESWWATEFLPPTYSEALPLALIVAPGFIEQTGTRIIDNILETIRDLQDILTPAYAKSGARRNLGPIKLLTVGVGDFLWKVARLFTRIIGWLTVLTLGLLVQLVMIALLLLGLIPPLRGTVVKLQLALTGWLGDAYVMALSPIRFDAMVSQVRRDIKWLASPDEDKGRCKRIALVAHSGGAPVAHAAVTGPDAIELDSDILLVTYGSGHSKVASIREAHREKSGFYQLSPYGRVVVGGLVVLTFVLGVQETPPQPWTFFALASVLGASIAFALIGGRAARAVGRFSPRVPRGGQWIDYQAVADIVPDDPITSDDGQTRTERINNLHSVAQDHGWYWHNDEEFVAEVARLLHAKAADSDLAADEGQKARLRVAQARRQDRVLRYLNAGLLLIVSSLVLLLDLGPAVAEWIGEPIRQFLLSILTSAVISSDALSLHAPTTFWANLLGAVVVALALVMWNKLALFALWKQWTRKEEDAMFEPDGDAGATKWQGYAKAFILASTLVPVGVLVIAVAQISIFNIGFPQGVQGIQSLLATIVGHTPVPKSVVADIAGSGILNLVLRIVLLSYAVATALTSLINAGNTWAVHSPKSNAGQSASAAGNQGERPTFQALLASLTARPHKPSPRDETELETDIVTTPVATMREGTL